MRLTRRELLQCSGAAALAGLGACTTRTEGGDAGAPVDADAEDLPPLDTGPRDAPPPREDLGVDSGAPDAGRDAGPTVEGPEAITEVRAAFPLHVMAGDARADSVVVWTRAVPSGAALSLRVYEVSGERYVAVVWEREVTPDSDGFVHVEVTGLRPGTRYRYVFLLQRGTWLEGRSPIGRFRAALAEGALEVVTFAGTSCTNQNRSPFPVMNHAGGRTDLDFFVHAGDIVYCDGADTVSEYRAMYAQNWTASGLQRLFSSVGLYATWDDHEVDNNFNPETIDPAKLAAARRVWFEHLPARRDPTAPDRLWRSFRWGRTLELFLLDARSERRPSTRRDPGGQYLSRAQLDWLKAGLLRSEAVFKVVVNSVPITDFPLAFDVAAADRWEGYPSQRDELLGFLEAQRVSGVWWLSGDFHMGVVGRVGRSGYANTMTEVLAGPGGHSPNVLAGTLGGPQFDWSGGENNYTVFRADPVARAMTVTFVDASGRELFSRRYT